MGTQSRSHHHPRSFLPPPTASSTVRDLSLLRAFSQTLPGSTSTLVSPSPAFPLLVTRLPSSSKEGESHLNCGCLNICSGPSSLGVPSGEDSTGQTCVPRQGPLSLPCFLTTYTLPQRQLELLSVLEPGPSLLRVFARQKSQQASLAAEIQAQPHLFFLKAHNLLHSSSENLPFHGISSPTNKHAKP